MFYTTPLFCVCVCVCVCVMAGQESYKTFGNASLGALSRMFKHMQGRQMTCWEYRVGWKDSAILASSLSGSACGSRQSTHVARRTLRADRWVPSNGLRVGPGKKEKADTSLTTARPSPHISVPDREKQGCNVP